MAIVVNNTLDYDKVMLAYKQIFEGYYYINIKAMYTYTQYALEVSGIPFTGDKEIDEGAANSYNTKPATIAEMAEYHQDNIKFYFTKQESIPKIYQHIRDYINIISELYRQNYLSQRKALHRKEFNEILADLDTLAAFANYLRSAISWIISTQDKQEEETYHNALRLINKLRYDRHGYVRDDPKENNYMPAKVELDENLKPTNLSGVSTSSQSRPWRRRGG